MSLDQNLFTLIVTPNKDDPNVVDLVDPSGIAHYRKQRTDSSAGYKAEVYDPMSESLLITATAPSSTSKVKILELCNPTSVVELKYTGTISFRWGFKWEEHEFEWKREECYMLRKPDPPVLVAVTKEPPGRLKTTSVQILDYNLNRFDIDDRKGLEIVILTALLTFQDANDSYHSQGASSNPLLGMGIRRRSSAQGSVENTSPPPPPPPPKPARKTGVDRIAEMQAIRGEYNEITIEDEGNIDDYAQYCLNLFEDDAMLFVTLKSAAAEQVPKVLQVVEQAKRIRHKAGLFEDEELHQYVLYDTITSPAQKGPKRIILDDSDKDKSKDKNKYTPPNSLTIHLSKIPMPELQPKANPNDKESKKKQEKKAPGPAPPLPSTPRPAPNRLTRPARSSSPHSRVQPYQTHPHQPSPSPSQLNNPGIYVAPPPRPPHAPYANSTSQGPPFPRPSTQNSPNRPNSFHALPSDTPSLYGPYVPPMNPATSGPYANQSLNIPTWQSQEEPPPSYEPQPQSLGGTGGGTQQRPVTPASVVSGILDMLHRR